jgi:hypothetical protein
MTSLSLLGLKLRSLSKHWPSFGIVNKHGLTRTARVAPQQPRKQNRDFGDDASPDTKY